MKESIINFLISTDVDILDKTKSSPKYEELLTESIEIYEGLYIGLDEEQRTLLKQYSQNQVEQEGEAVDIYFKVGVKYGIQLILECLLN